MPNLVWAKIQTLFFYVFLRNPVFHPSVCASDLWEWVPYDPVIGACVWVALSSHEIISIPWAISIPVFFSDHILNWNNVRAGWTAYMIDIYYFFYWWTIGIKVPESSIITRRYGQCIVVWSVYRWRLWSGVSCLFVAGARGAKRIVWICFCLQLACVANHADTTTRRGAVASARCWRVTSYRRICCTTVGRSSDKKIRRRRPCNSEK